MGASGDMMNNKDHGKGQWNMGRTIKILVEVNNNMMNNKDLDGGQW